MNQVNKKIAVISICFLFIITTFLPLTSSLKVSKIAAINTTSKEEIFRDIEETEDKVLKVDAIIGDLHVKYWEHVINDVLVQNDSILLHLDIEDGDIIKYEKSWTDIKSLDYEEEILEPDNYFWKKLVVFPDEDDCTFFYTFYDPLEYPVVCWEVRHTDGTTFMYDLDGDEIGYGLPTPSNGFSLSGWHWHPQGPDDPWISWRKNADKWFQKWCDSTESISLPPKKTVSSYVSDPSVEFFYEIAHGDYFSFLINDNWERYYFFTAKMDLEERSPMKFAFIGSCGGMDYTGPDSFSDSFRKGEMENTVTVGYTGMGDHPGWFSSKSWQDKMFGYMDDENTIYESFEKANQDYPIMLYPNYPDEDPYDPCVVFVGDENLKVNGSKSRSDTSSLTTKPLLLQLLEQFPLLTRLLSLRRLINFKL